LAHEQERTRQKMEIIRSSVPDATLAVLRQNDEGSFTIDFRLSDENVWHRWATDPDELEDERYRSSTDLSRLRLDAGLRRLRDVMNRRPG
jgi:hypothetical protein